jgi:hypothetical protein
MPPIAMDEKKNWGSTVLGWFVVREGDAATASGYDATLTETAEDPYAAVSDAPVAPAQPAATFATPPPAAPGGKVDFPAVWAAAGIDAEEQERVDKAAALLRSLPESTDAAVKKQIVQASLAAFGVPVDKIIETGVEEIQALEGYIQSGAGDTQTLLQESQARIAQLEAEVRNIRQVMEERVSEQNGVVKACNEKKLDIQRVLEFFGQEAVARVVRDSPKLIDPTAPGGAAPPAAS